MLDPRLVAQITTQILKDTTDLSHMGELLTCMNKEKAIIEQYGTLPAPYRWHLNRIEECAELACRIIEISQDASRKESRL